MSGIKVAVIGLGKIGLPLAAQYAKKNCYVIGADLNPRTVETVNEGQAPFPGEFGLDLILKEIVKSGNLRATTKTIEAVSESDAVVVAVPLFVDKQANPDFSALDAATESIGAGLKPGTLVAFETTLPVGTTRNRLVPILERTSSMVAGKDFFVVFSPERVLTGRVFSDLRRYPKLVGGVDKESESIGIEFYKNVLDFDERLDLSKPNGVWGLGSSEAAELAKLAETTYRDVNIALANQFAIHAESIGVDVYRVIDACNSQVFSHIHQPGIAVGGHCIPIYPHLYLHGDPGATVVSASRHANKKMPIHVIEKIEKAIGGVKQKKIAILGLAYRPGVKEHAFSGAWDLLNEIRRRGGEPLVHDPMYSRKEIEDLQLTYYELGGLCDAVVIQTDHSDYKSLSRSDIPNAEFLVDGRNCTSKTIRDSIPHYVLGIGAQSDLV